MMSSFYNGVEGVKTQSFAIDITANNISNINTIGFKYSGAEFRDVFYSTVTSQSTNPAQRGYSAGYSASKFYFEQGSPRLSEGEFDVALQGKGFFGVLGSDEQVYYTRNGSFRRDANGNLVDSYGRFVLGTMNPAFSKISYTQRVSELEGRIGGTLIKEGYTVNSDESFDMGKADSQKSLLVPTNMYLPPKPTQNVKWSGNLDTSIKTEAVKIELKPDDLTLTKNDEGKYIVSGSVSLKDAFGAKAGDMVILNFADGNGVKKSFEAILDGDLNFTSNALDLKGFDPDTLKLDSAQAAIEQQKANVDILEAPVFNADGSKSILRLNLERILPDVEGNKQYKAKAQIYDFNGEAVGGQTEGSLVFNGNGALLQSDISGVSNPNGGTIQLDFGTPYSPDIPGSGYGGIYVRQDKAKSIVVKHDGVAEGFFEKYSITEDGSILAQFDNGVSATVGKFALYNFINEEGLASVEGNVFAATADSGEASFITSNGELVNTAKFRGGHLEQSNVRLEKELSNLIITQKAFDASSRSITASDQMIQRAINMKK